MTIRREPPRGRALTILAAVLSGLFVADLLTVLLREPGLLRPAHWGGLAAIAVSGLILYATVGVMVLVLLAVTWPLCRLLRLKFTPAAFMGLSLLGLPFFLVVQQGLQERLLGLYISLRSPFFYVPTGLTLAALLAVYALVFLLGRRLAPPPPRVQRLLGGPGLAGTAAVVLFLGTALWRPHINVLGVYDRAQEREPRFEAPATAAAQPAPGAPNLVVLAIEAFRADQLDPANTPFLVQLARENIWFSHYYVAAAATRPSVTSFFTSLYPAQHGCYNLALDPTPHKHEYGDRTTLAVADSVRAYPKLLQQHGYRTVMITSNGLTADKAFGFGEVYRRFSATEPYRFPIPSPEPFVAFHFLKKNLQLSRVFNVISLSPEHSNVYFDAQRLNHVVLRETARNPGKPLCLYVHYMEPHSPYYWHPYRPLQLNLYLPSQRASLLGAYASELQAVDAAIAELFAAWQEQGLLENTWVLVTADHGEEFYDHRNWGHGKSLYPEIVHVPAILVPPPGQREPRRVDDVVDNVDVAATFAGLAGIAAPPGWEGTSLLAGLSPDQAAEGPPAGVALSQFNTGRVYWASAVRDGWQVILRRRGDRDRIMLFHLAEDPGARDDLVGRGLPEEAELKSLLQSELERLEATASLYRGEETAIDPQHLEQLRALGYVD